MKTIHWFENKQLDRVTNFSARTECLRNILYAGTEMYYYCSFANKKEYYGFDNNIKYLGNCRNKVLKFFEFNLLVSLKAFLIVLNSKSDVIITNQDLVSRMLPAIKLNRLLKKGNKFVMDIRTLPVSMSEFEKSMTKYFKQIKIAVDNFDGLSFITPYMGKVSLEPFDCKLPTATWSSGVDVDLFDASKYDYSRTDSTFRIFYHGGISESRGNLNLIKACETVKEKGYDIELVQLGKIVDKSLKEYIAEHKLESWCKLLDARPLSEIPAMVAKCDLPVLPFPDFLPWRVSSPIKLMEYMAMGKPVLVPDMECFTDVLSEDSGMAYYYRLDSGDDIEVIADAIIERIQKTDITSAYVKNEHCISFISDQYTWKQQALYLRDFCISLVK